MAETLQESRYAKVFVIRRILVQKPTIASIGPCQLPKLRGFSARLAALGRHAACRPRGTKFDVLQRKPFG
ncbi:hypothetical protein QUT06_22600, partial [Xanthomonas citri pv. citri]